MGLDAHFSLLNVFKPQGVTSRDVVDQVQRLLPSVKTGHAGTLDPLATGVLVICLGQATRLIEYVQRKAKHYRGEFLLGCQSDTEDMDGTVTQLVAPPIPQRHDIENCLPMFVGHIEQVPPTFSAKKVGGKRAYELARRGELVQLAPRRIRVDSLTLITYDYPRLEMDIICGSGTYVRSLGRDLARALHTEAAMSRLTRTAIGNFTVEDSIRLDELPTNSLTDYLISPLNAVDDLDQLVVTADELNHIRHGRSLIREGLTATEEVVAISEAGEFIAILNVSGKRLDPSRVFLKPP